MKTFALLALGAMVACDSESTFEPELDLVDSEAVQEVTVDIAALDRREGDVPLFDELASKIPGFAGFWFDRACNLHVVLTDLSQTELAKEVLRPYLQRYIQSHRCPGDPIILVHQGQFSWTELTTWLLAMEPAGRLDGVSRLGISIQLNRIVVGVDGRPTAARVLEIAEAAGVPAEAIHFRLTRSDTARDRNPDRRRDRKSDRQRG